MLACADEMVWMLELYLGPAGADVVRLSSPCNEVWLSNDIILLSIYTHPIPRRLLSVGGPRKRQRHANALIIIAQKST